MSTHKNPDTLALIEDLAMLGETLGFIIEQERPISDRGNGPAVDLAWLGDANQRFPLLIFEIDTCSSNSSTYNALKVLAKDSESFEKPVFFFHIFMRGNDESSPIKDLQEQYRTHNYRVYRIGSNSTLPLIKDVLSQHRRLFQSIDLYNLVRTLLKSRFFCNYTEDILRYVPLLKYQGDSLVPIARLRLVENKFEELFKEKVADLFAHGEIISPRYDSYIGEHWATPIHIGLMQFWTQDISDKWVNTLRRWQENSVYPTKIGPHFGLSRDYDEFIFTLAAAYWGLVAVLMKSSTSGGSYILKQYWDVFTTLKDHPSKASYFWAVWLLHIAAAFDTESLYESARVHLNENFNGSSTQSLYSPLGYVPGDDDDEQEVEVDRMLVPTMVSFCGTIHPNTDGPFDEIDLALHALLDPMATSTWGPRIARLLRGNRSAPKARTLK